MRNSRLCFYLTVLVAAVLLTGCDNSTSDKAGNTPSSGSTVDAAPSAASGKVLNSQAAKMKSEEDAAADRILKKRQKMTNP